MYAIVRNLPPTILPKGTDFPASDATVNESPGVGSSSMTSNDTHVSVSSSSSRSEGCPSSIVAAAATHPSQGMGGGGFIKEQRRRCRFVYQQRGGFIWRQGTLGFGVRT